MKKATFLIIILSIFIISCKTKPEDAFISSNLPGMIYDADNRPCSKVSVTTWTTNKKGEDVLLITVNSDINGRFTIPKLDRGSYRIEAEKEGFESLSTEIYYSSRLDILYLKIFSQKQILNLAENALEERRYGRVEEYLLRSEKINSDDPYSLYLKAVYLYEKESFSDALLPLIRILDQGFRFPYVHLLMADIYQYKLDLPEKALAQLIEYKNIFDDLEIKLRIKELEEL
jgi:hypothetical protein